MGLVKCINHYDKFIALAMGCIAFLAACSKDDMKEDHTDGITFSATIAPYKSANASKTYINEGSVNDYCCWSNGDIININGNQRTINVTQNTTSFSATLSGDGITKHDNSFFAAYPGGKAAFQEGSFLIDIPTTDIWHTIPSGAGQGSQLVEAPMVAHSTEHALNFENICTLTRFDIRAEGSGTISLHSISISCDKNISGKITANHLDGQWSFSTNGLDGNSRSLVVSDEAATLTNTAHPFFLYLPPVKDISQFTLCITICDNGVRHTFKKQKNSEFSFVSSQEYDFGVLTYNATEKSLVDGNGVEYIESAPSGTAEDPYTIESMAEWYYWIRQYGNDENKYFKLNSPISITEAIASFSGHLDGNSQTITLNDCALFEKTENGKISNVIVSGTIGNTTYLTNYTYNLGSIAANAVNCTIKNCHSHTTIGIEGDKKYRIGGLFGSTNGCYIDGCSNTGSISCTTTSTSYIGGLIGTTSSTATNIINSYNTGRLTSYSNEQNMIGGIVGQLAGGEPSIKNCFCHAEIIGQTGNVVGGITAQNSSTSTIANCYYWGNITGGAAAGGICHTNAGRTTYCYHPLNLPTCQSNGANGQCDNCNTLSNATTISNNTANSLPSILNNNIAALGLSNALYWKADNGMTTFDIITKHSK